MSTLLRSLVIRVGLDSTTAQTGLKNLSKDLKTTGKELKSTGASLTKGLTVPLVSAAVGMTTLAINAGKAADELITMSNKTGLTTDQLQEMEYAARFVDVEVETMTGSMIKLTKNMDMARRGSKEQEEAFKKLNVQYKNNDGTLRNAKEVWADVIDALGKVSSEADRDALALNLFGRSAAELNPLIKAGSGELNRLGKEAHTVGAVMSGETVTALGKFDDSMQKIQAVVKTGTGEIAAAFVPALESLLPVVENDIVPAIKSFAGIIADLIKRFGEMTPEMQKLVLGIAGVAVSAGPAMTALGGLATSASGIISKFGAATRIINGGGSFGAALSTMIGPAGIVALVAAGLATLGIVVAETIEKFTPGTKAIRNMVEASKDLRTNAKDAADGVEANALAARQLSSELITLSNKQGKSNDEIARMQMLAEQLNKLYPDLTLQVDRHTGSINKSTEEILDYIAARKEQLKLEIYESEYSEILKSQIDLSRQLKTEQENLTKATLAYDDALNHPGLYDWSGQIDVMGQAVTDAQQNVNLLTDEMKQNETALKDLDDSYAEVWKTISTTTEETIEVVEEETKAVEINYKAQAKMLKDFKDSVKENQDRMMDDYEEYIDTRENQTKKHLDEMGGLDDKGIEKTKLTAKEIKRNLMKQIEDFQEWRASIKQLSSRVPEEVMTELRALGPSFAPVIEELNGMTDEQLQGWVDVWQEKGALARDAAVEEVDDLPGAMYTIGKNGAINLRAGLMSGLPGIKEAAQAITRGATIGQLSYALPTKSKPGISAYAEGTSYVPQTGPALIHEGEAVLTREENASFSERIASAVASAGGGDVVVNVYVEDILTATQKTSKRKNARTGRVTIPLGV